jgi:hypothetical protein
LKAPVLSIWSPPTTEIASGIAWLLSLRWRAVTRISVPSLAPVPAEVVWGASAFGAGASSAKAGLAISAARTLPASRLARRFINRLPVASVRIGRPSGVPPLQPSQSVYSQPQK